MGSRRQAYEARAATAALAHSRIAGASHAAAAQEAVAAIDGGAGGSLAALEAEIATLRQRIDDAEIP